MKETELIPTETILFNGDEKEPEKASKKSGNKTLLIILIISLIVVIGFFMYQNLNKK